MAAFDRPQEVEVRPDVETNIDLPDIPIGQTRTVDELQLEARIEKCVDSIRKDLHLEGHRLDNNVYKQESIAFIYEYMNAKNRAV